MNHQNQLSVEGQSDQCPPQQVRAAIATIDEQAWTPMIYPNAIVDPDTGELISSAEAAETGYTAFASDGPPDRSPPG